MGIERDTNCFVCGKDNPIGLRLKVMKIDGGVRAEFTPKSLYEGYKGYIHGGIISALLDEVMIWAAKLMGKRVMSAELSVRFKRPVPVDKTITIEGKITDVKKRLLYGEACIYNDENTVLATATGKLVGME
ncbi:PaaI family thioesterase [candidate division WOR-3 bacterium]|nr:PaaI family thioesterase [candidate division WOR-3 bacterium]